MSKDELEKLFKRHVLGTKYKDIITIKTIPIGNIPSNVKLALNLHGTRVYMTSISLKHIYDKHTYKTELGNEFKFILTNLHRIIKSPNQVTSNKTGRKGDYCFIKTIVNKKIIVTLQKVDRKLYIVTSFVLKDEGYLSEVKSLWKL